MIPDSATAPATNTCDYCGIPCPNRFCSWDCMRNHGQSETTWRRNAEQVSS